MEIFINHSQIDFAQGSGTRPHEAAGSESPTPPLTWGQLLTDILDNFIEPDHHIISLQLNDEHTLAPKEIPALANEPVPGNLEKINFITKDTFSITKDTFVELFTLVDSIRCEILPCANLYRNDQTQEATIIIKKIMSSIRPMIDFINSVGMNFALDFHEMNTDRGITIKEEIQSFVTSFSRLVKLKEKKDNKAIAEFLEHHFLDDITAWSKTLKKLLWEISQPSNSNINQKDRRRHR